MDERPDSVFIRKCRKLSSKAWPLRASAETRKEAGVASLLSGGPPGASLGAASESTSPREFGLLSPRKTFPTEPTQSKPQLVELRDGTSPSFGSSCACDPAVTSLASPPHPSGLPHGHGSLFKHLPPIPPRPCFKGLLFPATG